MDDNADWFIFSLVYTVSIIHHTGAGNVMWHATPRKRKKSFTCRDSKRQGNSTRVLYFDCHLRTEGLRVWKVPCNFESIIIDDDWWCLACLCLSRSQLLSRYRVILELSPWSNSQAFLSPSFLFFGSNKGQETSLTSEASEKHRSAMCCIPPNNWTFLELFE